MGFVQIGTGSRESLLMVAVSILRWYILDGWSLRKLETKGLYI